MQYGLWMGIFWACKYIFFMLSVYSPLLNGVYFSLTMVVPVVAYFLTVRYRNDVGGAISFLHAWQFGILIYLFAGLIVSLLHYIYYQYLLPPEMLNSIFNQLTDYIRENITLTPEMTEVLDNSVTPSAIQMTLQGIMNNVFFGIIFSIPVALLVRRRGPYIKQK